MWPPQERQSASSLIEALMRERGLARGFERPVQRAAKRARDRGLDVRGDLPSRRDLTDLATFTIDPVSARDFDDAISGEALGSGATRVWVHIADVSAYVPEGSPVDVEARARATSVYVPGAVEPMLPPELSSDACSLVPARERLAVTVELVLDGAAVQSAEFYRSVIRSDERLDYERVDRIFAGEEPALQPWATSLAAARTAAAALQRAREQRGALAVDSEEPEFIFDEHGNITEIRARKQTESHRLIEHLMITANEAVAGLLARQRVPCLYRVHERPEHERVERLVAQLASLGVPTPALPKRMSSSQATELVGVISQRLEEHVRRTGHGGRALNALILRSLKQAYYSPKNLGHAGLRSANYCHFTSPIRRYPDLVCHRALLSAVGAGESAPRAGELSQLGEWTSEREREAMKIERDADDVAACFDLERRLYEEGWEQEFTGEVVGLIAAGAFVAFGRPAAPGADKVKPGEPVYEGMLAVRNMHVPSGERDWWEINEEGTILRGERSGATLRLGDQLAVRVSRVDTPRGRVDLLPVVEDPQEG
ncbi:MAG: ribonuclease [Solirubrobacteraceae bacterium]|nr:ribonuclease [Solirubrobacteraceae bacterium]MEA2225354.1 ribonuclease [Solirubrobacteraceae bacterium]MEA2335535.1 ribonuclease [Solirubrobacteraceae bacterium]